LRAGAVVNSASEPVFVYLDKDGAPLATQGAGVLADPFKNCARVVQIRLRVIAAPGDTKNVIDQLTQVNLRNYHEGSGC
jgi:hypothetical protein